MESAASVHDVAAYILQKHGPMSAMKLEKLAYYSQAWSLVWDERTLFSDNIEAWAHGPVVPALYEVHRGQFHVDAWPKGNPDALDKDAKDTVNAVIGYYGHRNAQWLSDLTHREKPWIDARVGLQDGERGNAVITLESMMDYYSNLNEDGEE